VSTSAKEQDESQEGQASYMGLTAHTQKGMGGLQEEEGGMEDRELRRGEDAPSCPL